MAWSHPRRWRTTVAVSLALTVLVVHAGPSEATWTVPTFASGTVSAKVIPPPTLGSTCTLDPGLLGADPTVTITWQFPAGSGYVNPANVRYYVASGGLLPALTNVLLGSNLTTTGPVGGVYTTKFLSGLLSGLLGGTYLVGIRSYENTWTSTLASANASMLALGANPTCVINPIYP